ncbi:hypothetical protein BKA93DRAFT_729522 [Sparassis latifolia]
MHVISHNHIWHAKDLQPGSSQWKHLWADDHGSCWIFERTQALELLQQFGMDNLYSDVPIIALLFHNQHLFNGFGRHTANDVLFWLKIFPTTPASHIFADKDHFQAFASGLAAYVDQFCTRTFFRNVAGEVNSTNPLTYNYKSGRNYISMYVKIFRKHWCKVPRQLYNEMLVQGLFDPQHVIGM